MSICGCDPEKSCKNDLVPRRKNEGSRLVQPRKRKVLRRPYSVLPLVEGSLQKKDGERTVEGM